MIKIINHFSLGLLVLVTLVGCNSGNNSTTYFGGKIINPKSNHVVLFSKEKVIDTFYLNEHNRFLGKIKDAKEGLYHFKHGSENQFIYIEPLDSLMLRLNTWDFDESLVFAGKGADRNNILIDCFLDNEKDNRKFYKLNYLEPKEFKFKIDSILSKRIATYEEYTLLHPNETEGFNKVLKVALTYPIFARIERYPIAHLKYADKTDFHALDESFFNHRKEADLNNASLMYYPPYTQYLRNYLYNITYAMGHKPMTNEYSSEFTIDLLKTINDKITIEKSKNAFLKQTLIGHFYRKSSCDVNKTAFDTYFDLSTSQKDKDHVRRMMLDNQAVHKGKQLANFDLYDYTNGKHSIHQVIKDKNTFLFFWNPEYVSPVYISSRMKYLTNRFPDINFIQIKIDGNAKERIHKLDIKSQFYIDAKSEANNFLTSKMPRSIMVNKNGIVQNGYASLSSLKVHHQLKELAKN